MMKRLLAALLSLTLLLSAVTPAWADGTGYTYPSVSVTLLPDEMAAMEMEFRAWAHAVIYQYYVGRYGVRNNATTSGEPYAEYYRLAATKLAFDGKNILDEDIIYNTLRDSDWTKNEGVYTWVLVESLKEYVQVNGQAIKERYDRTPKEDRKYLLLDGEDGDLRVDDIAIATHAQAEEQMQNAISAALMDVALLGVDSIVAYYTSQSAKQSDGMYDLIDMALESVDTLWDSMVESANANAERHANNLARETVINELATQLCNMDMQIVYFLRETYSDDNTIVMYGHDKLVKTFIDMIDPEKNPQMALMLAEESRDYVKSNAAAIQIIEATGQEYLALMDTETMITLAFIEVFGEIMKGLLEALQTEIETATDDAYITIKGKTAVCIKWSTISEVILETLSETLNQSIDTAINKLYTEFDEGGEFESQYAINMVKNQISTDLSDGQLWEFMWLNLLEKVPEMSSDIFAGAYGGGSYFEYIMNIFSGALDSEVMYDGLNEGKIGFDDIKKLIANMLKAYHENALDYEGNIVVERMSSKETWEKLGEKVKIDMGEKTRHKKEERTVSEIDAKWSLVNVALDVCERAWDTGTEIGEALQSTSAYNNSEGILSLLGSRVVAARNLSRGVMTEAGEDIRTKAIVPEKDPITWAAYDFVEDPDVMSVEEIVDIISMIHTQLKYDIIGTKSYWDITFQGFVREEFKNAEFWKYIKKNHVNIFNNIGLLTNDQATYRYNWAVGFWQDYFVTQWDDSWQIFLDGSWREN